MGAYTSLDQRVDTGGCAMSYAPANPSFRYFMLSCEVNSFRDIWIAQLAPPYPTGYYSSSQWWLVDCYLLINAVLRLLKLCTVYYSISQQWWLVDCYLLIKAVLRLLKLCTVYYSSSQWWLVDCYLLINAILRLLKLCTLYYSVSQQWWLVDCYLFVSSVLRLLLCILEVM